MKGKSSEKLTSPISQVLRGQAGAGRFLNTAPERTSLTPHLHYFSSRHPQHPFEIPTGIFLFENFLNRFKRFFNF